MFDCPSGTHWSDAWDACVANSHKADPGHPWWFWGLMALAGLAFLMLIPTFLRIVQASEKGVVFRLGRYARTVDPGPRFMWPFIEKMQKVSMQLETVELDQQQVITNDSVSLAIKAVVYYKVVEAKDSVIKIDDVEGAISRLAPAIMRRVIGKHQLANVLSHDEGVDNAVKAELEQATTDWGVKIDRIELQDTKLPDSMRRAMAARAESEREADAKVIASDGELRSAENLQKAASLLNPTALRLRELATIREIGTDNATIIVVQGDNAAQVAGNSAAGALGAASSASKE